VIALEGPTVIGLTKDSVFVNVTLNELEVEFLNVQKVPPCELRVDKGVLILLKLELVM
jgi:hypothetical protein